METEFSRLQNEKETQMEEHRKADDERASEYNQYKQEKSLEISSLKGKGEPWNITSINRRSHSRYLVLKVRESTGI